MKSKKGVKKLIYNTIADCHRIWREKNGFALNNFIIDSLRNQLWHDVAEWYEIYITKRAVPIPAEKRCSRQIMADLSHRRFAGKFTALPCEICGYDRAPNTAHIIPKAVNGPDDDWNLIHLCANHHYLFDRGLLTLEEWNSIDWDTKGSEAVYFAERVRLKQHKSYWAIETE